MIAMDDVNRFVVGILGGMGSYSTLHFFQQILDAFDVDKEWERPRIVIDNHCILPSRTRAILYGERRDQLVAGMAQSIEGLLRYDPHIVCMPCNTAHCFLPEVRARLGGRDDRVLDMIELVASACEARGTSRAFLLATEGTIATGVYDDYFGRRGMEVVSADEAQQRAVRAYIEQVKQKRGLDPAGFSAFIDGLGLSPVILGCTELSVLYDGCSRAEALDPLAMMVGRIRQLSDDLNAAARSPHPSR